MMGYQLGGLKIMKFYFLLKIIWYEQNELIILPLSVSSTTSTTLSICCTPTTLKPCQIKFLILTKFHM